jgi:predicted nucleic acid-binding protein
VAQTLVLDASVVIALLDENDALHERAAAVIERARSDELILPASAFAEILVAPYRQSADAVARFETTLAEVPVRVEPLTATIARRAASLRASHARLRLADALVLATAAEAGAVVLTADRALARHARVTLV